MTYRSFSQIVKDILETAKDGKSKTCLMSSANLSYYQLRRYSSALEKASYLEKVDSKLKTTDRGLEAIKILQESILIEENVNRHMKKK